MVTTAASRPEERLPSLGVPLPDELADRLRSVKERLDELDAERDRLVEERDELVVEAREYGGSLREIAELLGVTHPLVAHIEKKRRG